MKVFSNFSKFLSVRKVDPIEQAEDSLTDIKLANARILDIETLEPRILFSGSPAPSPEPPPVPQAEEAAQERTIDSQETDQSDPGETEITETDLTAAEPFISVEQSETALEEEITITAGNFEEGSTILFQLTADSDQFAGEGEATAHAPFYVTDGMSGDLDGISNGDVITTWMLPAVNGSVGGISLTARGNGADGEFLTADDQLAVITFEDSEESTLLYIIGDEDGSTGTATISEAPSVESEVPQKVGTIADQSNAENETFAGLDVKPFFRDPSSDDALSYSDGGTLPPGLAINPLTGIISGTFDAGTSSDVPYSVSITADNGKGGTTTQEFSWSVAARDASILTEEDVSAIAEAAVKYWESTDLTPDQLAALSNITYQIVDIDGFGLGSAEGNLISVDLNANGRGWFVDSTPFAHEEFQVGEFSFLAVDNEAAARIDLLSVLLHEQGHVLGLDESADRSNVMFNLFGLGERRLPEHGEADGASPGSLDGVHFVSSDLISVASSTVSTDENVTVHLGIEVDPSILLGGTLEDVIGVTTGYRAAGSASPTTFTIPADAKAIRITGYSNLPTDTSANNLYNDDYQILNARIDLADGVSSGTLSHIVDLSNGSSRLADQYSWTEANLGTSVLTGTGTVNGDSSGGTDPLFTISGNTLSIVENHSLQTSFHIEFLTNENTSTNFLGTLSDVQEPSSTTSTFTLPAEADLIVLTENSAAPGSDFNQESKNYSRIIIDLNTMTASGTIMAEIGETADRTVAYGFENYDISVSTPGGVLSSSANLIGDTSGLAAVAHSPNIYINGSGELVVERTAAFAGANFTSMYNAQLYERVPYSSISTRVGSGSDSTFFDATAGGGVVNTLTYNVPASAKVGIFQFSMGTIGGNGINENMGSGFAVVDLEAGTSSGSFMNIRTTTPDLVSWQGVSLTDDPGTGADERVFFNHPDTVSNRSSVGQFTDGWGATAYFNLTENPDGTRTLTFNAISDVGNNAFQDYEGHGQFEWLGKEAFRLEANTTAGTFSHGSPVLDVNGNPTGEWEVDVADLNSLSFIPEPGVSGDEVVEITLKTTGEQETITVNVHPIANTPDLTLTDPSTVNEDTPADLSGAISSVVTDTDGSESVSLIEVSAIPDGFTLSDGGGNTFTAGSGVNAVDITAWNLAGLTLTPAENFFGTVNLNVRSQTTDQATVGGVLETDTTEVTDTNPGETQATGVLNVTFAAVDDDPEAVGTIAAQTSNDGDSGISFDVSGAFTDPDGDTLEFDDGGTLPPGLSINPITGEITGTIDGDASQFGTGGVYTVTITADDQNGGTPATQTFQWTVTNPPPVAQADGFSAGEDDGPAVVGDALANDNDPDGDSISAVPQTGVTGSDGGIFSISDTGEVTFDPNGDFEHLGAGDTDTTTFTYTVIDADGATDTATVTVTVTGVNDATVTIDDVSVSEGGTLDFTATLDKKITGGFTVDVSTITGTADLSDYTSLTNVTLTFSGTAGETVNFSVSTTEEGLIENDETLGIVMGNVSDPGVIITDTATGTILDDDAVYEPSDPSDPGVTTDLELVNNPGGGVDLVIEDVETDSSDGFASTVGDSDSADHLNISRVGNEYVISDSLGNVLGSPIIGATRTGPSEIRVPVSMVTGSIVVRTGQGNDIINVNDIGALNGGLVINGHGPSDPHINDFDVINYDSDFSGSGVAFGSEVINIAGGSTLTTTSPAGVDMDARRNIVVGSGATITATGGGDIAMDAHTASVLGGSPNFNGDSFAAIDIAGADLSTTTGNVSLSGRGGQSGDNNRGVYIRSSSNIDSGGLLSVDGVGGDGGSRGMGVEVFGSDLSSGGLMTLAGSGGGGVSFNYGINILGGSALDSSGGIDIDGAGGSGERGIGVSVMDSQISSAAGTDVAIDGTGGASVGTSSYGLGVEIVRTTVDSSGAVDVIGTGGNGLNYGTGVTLASADVDAADAITITGSGNGSGNLNGGVAIDFSTEVSAGGGTLTISGTGANGDSNNYGVSMNRGGSLSGSTGLVITGTGSGTGGGNRGIYLLNDLSFDAGSGDLVIMGTASQAGDGSGSHNSGVDILRASAVATGTVTVSGTGGIGALYNYGVTLKTFELETDGNISISGTGGDATSNANAGVALDHDTSITSTAGSIAVTGTALGGNSYNAGFTTNRGLVLDAASGVTIRATGAGTGSRNHGVSISGGASIDSGSGDLLIEGTGTQNSSTIGSANSGVSVSAASAASGGMTTIRGTGGIGVSSNTGVTLNIFTLNASGNVIIEGTGGDSTGLSNSGVSLDYGTSITSSGGGLTISGTAVGGTHYNVGAYFRNASLEANSVALLGTGAGSGYWNVGVRTTTLNIRANAGTISIDGTGGDGIHYNYGVLLQSTANVATGDIILSGTGGAASGNSNYGLALMIGTTVTSTGGGITVVGQASGGVSYNSGVYMTRNGEMNAASGVTIVGTGAGSGSYNSGIYVISGGRIDAGSGDLNIAGSATSSPATGSGNSGLHISILTAVAGGAASITGVGGEGVSSNYGSYLRSVNISAAGDVSLAGTGGNGSGQSNAGVSLDLGASVSSSGGRVDIDGAAGSGTNFNYGVIINRSSLVRGSGGVAIAGTGAGTGSNNRGVFVNYSTVDGGSGLAEISGTASGSGSWNTGVSLVNSTLTGDSASVTGSGPVGGTGGGGVNNFGAYIHNLSGGVLGLADVVTDPDDSSEKGGNFFNFVPGVFLVSGILDWRPEFRTPGLTRDVLNRRSALNVQLFGIGD